MDPKRPTKDTNHQRCPRLRLRDWVTGLVHQLLDVLAGRIRNRRPLETVQSLLEFPIVFHFTRLYYYMFRLTLMTLENADHHGPNPEGQLQAAGDSTIQGNLLFEKIFPDLNCLPEHHEPAPVPTPTREDISEENRRYNDGSHTPRTTLNIRHSRRRLVETLMSLYHQLYLFIEVQQMTPAQALEALASMEVVWHDSRIYYFFQQILVLRSLVAIEPCHNTKRPRMITLTTEMFRRLFAKVFPEYMDRSRPYKRHRRF